MATVTIQQAFNIAIQHQQAGRLAEAEQIYRQILAHEPNQVESLHFLGVLASQTGRHEVGAQFIRRAIQLQPNNAAMYNNLGEALRLHGRLDEAIAAYRKATALQPHLPDTCANLGTALSDLGRQDEAIAALRQSIAMRPNFPETHYALSQALLMQGKFAEGWTEYEWRWFVKDFPSTRPKFSQPRWDGATHPDATLLFYNEQGFGDCIQAIRYIPMAAQRCKRVIVWCSPPTQRLFQSVAGVGLCITSNEMPPAFDFHCQLMSLPFLFGTVLETIPSAVPYVHADARDIERWRERIANDPPGLKVGLAWAGRPTHSNDRKRSLPLSLLASRLQTAGVQFYSLQTGDAAAQVNNLPAGVTVIARTDQLTDFADTAALIANLDLVISIDSAVAHLAGAMGKPVWTLLPYVPDWRWLLDRQNSPWYPTMRLFRQLSIGGWDSVIADVGTALEEINELRTANALHIGPAQSGDR